MLSVGSGQRRARARFARGRREVVYHRRRPARVDVEPSPNGRGHMVAGRAGQDLDGLPGAGVREQAVHLVGESGTHHPCGGRTHPRVLECAGFRPPDQTADLEPEVGDRQFPDPCPVDRRIPRRVSAGLWVPAPPPAAPPTPPRPGPHRAAIPPVRTRFRCRPGPECQAWLPCRSPFPATSRRGASSRRMPADGPHPVPPGATGSARPGTRRPPLGR